MTTIRPPDYRFAFTAGLAAMIAAALIASGCALPTQTSERVMVPVPVPCEVAVPHRPPLPVDSLHDGASIFDHVRALWASVEVLESHADQLTAALNVCRSD